MKYYLKIIVISIYFFAQNLNAQELNRRNLISQFTADKESLFVINGIPFLPSDGIKLDKELGKIDTSKIVGITALKNSGIVSPERRDVIVIYYAIELEKKIIRRKFKEIKTKFKDKYINSSQPILSNAKDPVLIINGKTINPTESKVILKKLSKSEIAYIYNSTEAVKVEENNSNYKNGAVTIWTKDKLKE